MPLFLLGGTVFHSARTVETGIRRHGLALLDSKWSRFPYTKEAGHFREEEKSPVHSCVFAGAIDPGRAGEPVRSP